MGTVVRFRRVLGSLAAVIVSAALGSAPPAFAQQQLGAVQGTIVDSTGSVLPGVTVTVTNVDTGAARSTTTNDTGLYRMPSLEPGRYKVVAELPGFQTVTRGDLIVSVGATLGVNFTLAPGALQEQIQVTGVSPDIQTEKADVSSVVESKKINDLPLVGRNVLSLAALQPGINGIPGTQDFLSPEQGLGVTANGVRESGNNATVDGASINNGPWGGTMLIVPNVEAVQEFQVIANNPSAEYGRNSGAMVSVITKSGTNVLSGSAFEFHRNQNLRARGFFENRAIPKADFHRNDFGGSLGGPIKRDNTFFFATAEIVRELTGTSSNVTVETQELVNWVNANRPNSIAAQLFKRYAPPSYPTTDLRDLGGPLPGANVWSTTPDGIPDVGTISVLNNGPRNGDQINFRVDQVFRESRDRLRATYYLSNIETQFLYTRPQFNHPYPFRNQLFNVAHTWMISASTLNEANFGIVRQHGEAGDPTPESPNVVVGNGVAGFGVEFWHPITFTQNNFQFKNTLTMNRGRHSFRTGGELRLGRDGATLHHYERPNFNFQSILDFIDDEPFGEDRAVDPATGLPTTAYGKYLTNEWSLFVQDNWKVRSNLTLNLGLRYDNFGNPKKDKIPYNGIILGPGSTRAEQIAGARVGTVDRLYDTDWNNFAPRLGITWDPSSQGKLVLRGGGGISYNRINNTVFSDERLNPPQFAHAFGSVQDGTPIVYSLGPTFTPNPALGRGVDERGGIRGARVGLVVVDPELVIPEYYNWFAGVQYQLPLNYVVEATYNGSKGRHLMNGDGPGGEDYNRFSGDLLDNVRNRLNPSFAGVGLNESRISSNYQGVSLQVQRRYSHGLAFQSVYTYGVAKDDAGSAMIVERPGLDYSYANFDIRHRVALNFVWEIPYKPSNAALNGVLGGWQVNGLAILQSGAPFTVTCGLAYPRCDFNADGVNNDRVNLPASGTDLGKPTREEWLAGVLTATDFTNPAVGEVGNEPRNAFRGPGFKNADLSLVKNFRFAARGGRSSTIQVRVETFNAFNWVNLNNPSSATNNANFGRVTSARGGTGGPRVVQLGLKVMF
jgi:carboxypeptidase family protein/TonB-dependent receptor-like protein